jgi:nucleotide-binding universal stress UspA family protein
VVGLNSSNYINLMFQRILIATGDSPASATVLEAGLTLAEKLGACIMLLHVMNLLTGSFETLANPLIGGTYALMDNFTSQQQQETWHNEENLGLERLQTYAAQAKARQIEAEISQNLGEPGAMICETAKNWSADLIVVGRNQKSALSELFLGSTSNYVLHHAPCAVIAIRQV